jgi:ABC-type oligopeptide transport system substrate-binding subunit
MKHYPTLILVLVLLAGCSPSPASAPEIPPTPTITPSSIPPTATFTPSPVPPTETAIPSPTPLPGKLVLPVDTLGKTLPWLPMDETARPSVHYVAFNTLRPPFNNALVRQAFVYAVDRQVILEMAEKYHANNPRSATTLTPPITLSRDLYNEVGLIFDPEKAQALLLEAGYADPSAFPPVTLIVNSYGDIAPGARFNMASAMAAMWETNLGVSVQVEAMTPPGFGERLKNNLPELFWLGWVADVNDPDNFLREIFHSGSEYNYGNFANTEFDDLVGQAKRSRDPAERQELYILAERLLCETEAAVIPLYHATTP